MSDVLRAGPEGETPVNPYSLLEAVNNSSDTAHTAWLIFLAVIAYFTVAVAGVTHRDLLLESPISLPILQVSIQQQQFFQFAPIVLVLFHLGVISQLVLLAKKTLEFDYAVQALEATDRRTHPLRLELHNFFFVQAVAGPQRSVVMSAFLHGMSWLTLVVIPVVLLLYIQISFLPYHDETITWVHRICLLADIFMLVLIGNFLMRADSSFFTAFFRTTAQHPFSFVLTSAIMAVVAFFSFFVATIPGEPLDRLSQTLAFPDRSGTRNVAGFAMPFVGGRADGSLWGIFYRNLVVSDTDLVPDRRFGVEETSLALRSRDLRYARLDRSDLHRADLTDTDLEGASLIGADLSEARLSCADVPQLVLTEDRRAARCATAIAANLSRAKLTNARLSGIDLRAARLDDAQLDGADLSHALLAGANLTNARLDKADLTGGVQLQGAQLIVASLQGADLQGAKLQAADLSSATLQGAILAHAQLDGATLQDADLEGVDLEYATLAGTNMTGAKLRAADLRGARVWQTSPPNNEQLVTADLSGLLLDPPNADDGAALSAELDRIALPRLRARIKEQLASVLSVEESRKWASSRELAQWQTLAQQSRLAAQDEGYSAKLTDHLTSLACKVRWSNGAIAIGIGKRALGDQFKGSVGAIYEKLRSKDCPANEAVPRRLLQTLSTALDTPRGN
jgi:uncharacterized protein YjbI with pentapeptide repeats